MIANRKTKAPEATKIVEKSDLVLNTSTNVDIDTPIAKMKEYTTGTWWDGITYYKQIKGEDDNITPLDVNSSITIQQYDKIKNYRLKLLSPLGLENAGDAVVLHFRPQQHDMFRARLLNGDIGLFVVNEVKVMNFNNTDAFEISFSLAAREKIDSRMFTNIEEKVVKELYYDKDSNYLNSSPILLKQEWDYALWLKDTVEDLTRYYIAKYKDRRSNMLVVDKRISIDTVTLFLSMCDLRDRATLEIVVPGCLSNIAEPLLLALRHRDINMLNTGNCCYNVHPNPLYSTLVYERLEIKDSSLFGYYFNKGEPQTDLEKFIYSFITESTIDKEQFKELVKNIVKEEPSIGYMIIPIFILIAKEELRTNASDLRRI